MERFQASGKLQLQKGAHLPPPKKNASTYHVWLLRYYHFSQSQGCYHFRLEASLLWHHGLTSFHQMLSFSMKLTWSWTNHSENDLKKNDWVLLVCSLILASTIQCCIERKIETIYEEKQKLSKTKWAWQVRTDLLQDSEFEKWQLPCKNVRKEEN